MKTLILTLSPRKNFSASMYFSKVLKFFMGKSSVRILELKSEKQYIQVEKQLDKVDNIVFVTPVYVDTIPSTVLEKLQKMERYAKDKDIKLNVYAITNCGFYEGEQCELAQTTFKIWCEKCKFSWKGGLGIGAGVMVAFIRTLIPIGVALTLIEILIRVLICLFSGAFTVQGVFQNFFPYSLLIQTILYLLWSMGMFVNTYKMAKFVLKGRNMSIKYTTIWFCPRFLFVILASMYWVIASVVWYRGAFWRIHKEPRTEL